MLSRRWSIAVLVTTAIAISYLDRQTLPVAVDAIRRDIPISNTQYSHLQVAFLLAYAAMYMGGGRLIDVLGTRRGFFGVAGAVSGSAAIICIRSVTRATCVCGGRGGCCATSVPTTPIAPHAVSASNCLLLANRIIITP